MITSLISEERRSSMQFTFKKHQTYCRTSLISEIYPSHPRLPLQLLNLLARLRLAHPLGRHLLPRILRHRRNIPGLLPRGLIIARGPPVRILDRFAFAKLQILASAFRSFFPINPTILETAAPQTEGKTKPKRKSSWGAWEKDFQTTLTSRGPRILGLRVLELVDLHRGFRFVHPLGVHVRVLGGRQGFQEAGLFVRGRVTACRPLAGFVEL